MQKLSAGTVYGHNFASCSLHRAFITENAFMLIFLKKWKRLYVLTDRPSIIPVYF
jgi:hypothetical protein